MEKKNSFDRGYFAIDAERVSCSRRNSPLMLAEEEVITLDARCSEFSGLSLRSECRSWDRLQRLELGSLDAANLFWAREGDRACGIIDGIWRKLERARGFEPPTPTLARLGTMH